MARKLWQQFGGLALGGAACAAAAQEVAAPITQTLEPVVLTATRAPRLQLDVPASVSVLSRAEIRDAQLRVNLSESLVRVPGVVALNRENYAQDLQISIRGFGARSSFGVRGIRLYLDGVPATQPDGQGQVSNFPLNAAQTIEVLRGPFSALYGNSSGGVIAMSTRLLAEPFTAQVAWAGGSDAVARWSASASGGNETFAGALDVSHFSTDGSRAHSAAQRDVVNLSGALLDTPLGQVRLNFNSLAMPDAQDPLGLTLEQWRADPGAAAPEALQFNTRKTTRQTQGSAQLTRQLGPAWRYELVAWTGKRSVQQFQAIPQRTQLSASSPGGVIDFDRHFGGSDLRLQFERSDWSATAGLAWERLDEDRRGYENFVSAGSVTVLGVQGRLRRDEANQVESLDPYAQLEWRPAADWRVHAGMRRSRVSFDSRDHYIVGANGDDSGAREFQSTNPSAGVVWRPAPRASVYVAWGRGFETPTLNELAYRPDGSAGINLGVQPARSNNWELGSKAELAPGLQVSAALFTVATRNEIVVIANAGGRAAYGNAGATRRRGAELALDWRPAPAWSAYLAATALQAQFDAAFLTCVAAPCLRPSAVVAAGNRLPGVPAYNAYGELRWQPGASGLRLEWRAQSRMLVDDRNTAAAPGYGIVNLVASHELRFDGLRFSAFVRANNLADRGYAGSVIVNEANGRYYEPAPGRRFLLGLEARI